MSKVARSADLRMFEDCESFEETEQSGSHMVSKGTFDTYLILSRNIKGYRGKGDSYHAKVHFIKPCPYDGRRSFYNA
ncbi:hypothetical protein, partial [Butyrivibrio fibrisolvens]|uniref:hypothetical protein n=1 Tax=Butyrivibrio fibrisolvens TaxID=831 RepID=UPI001A99F91C